MFVVPSNWQTQLFQMNQSEESSKINKYALTTSGQLDQRSITSAVHYNRIYSIMIRGAKDMEKFN